MNPSAQMHADQAPAYNHPHAHAAQPAHAGQPAYAAQPQIAAGQAPRLVYPLNGVMKVFLIILGIASIPLFLIGLLVLRVAFQKLVLEPDKLVIKTIYTKRIPYSEIVGIRWLNSSRYASAAQRESWVAGTIGVELRGKRNPFTIPITKFANTDDFLRQLSARTGHPVRPVGT